MKCKDIINILEKMSPLSYALDWDNSGLVVGREEKEIKKIMIALDATGEVIDQAVQWQADMIIIHHPMMFSPVKRVTDKDFMGEKIIKLIQNDISCYAMHTNFDVCVMADEAAKRLELKNVKPLDITDSEEIYKIVVYVPSDSADVVRDTMTKEGAGYIGEYSHCTFNLEGIGTFKPLEGTNPYIGSVNELVSASEIRIETAARKDCLNKIVTGMLKVHPYEEPAYDVYKLHNQGKLRGIGKYGYLKENMNLRECAEFVKNAFGLTNVIVSGNPEKRITLAAVSPGSGKSMVKHALRAKADVLITGDIDHHTALDSVEQGLCIIDGGHFGTEHMMVDYVKNYLGNCLKCGNLDWDSQIQILVAEEKSPFYIV